eukprot:CAMPEP_0178391224 /NCGR_PEP_ID=MMETSP0689_2-20121128/11055_1 /TAXON_ID=160604 /ORGANISM="Amphidinium massartii, Strain CS-259" /LENGTH=415 /DNA_ID=CAMNT_0020011765 /DNA_START=86 /DNA_END=1333 /DNA_ORIENTATION=+
MDEAKRRAASYDVYAEFPRLEDAGMPATYTPSCILVTGVAGFIASHVAIRLARLYPHYRIVGVDKISYCSDAKYVTEPLANCTNFRFVQANVCDYSTMVALMKEESIDTVLHLAGQSHVDLSFREGGAMLSTMDNMMGTATLLEAARHLEVKRFIHCSTDEVYGEGDAESKNEFNEETQMLPNNPYAATKAGADLLVQSFYRSFKFPVIITRGNNVYGPHQFYDKVIPKFVTQLLMGRQITVHGQGRVTRNFLHVQDTASAFDAILHRGEVGESYNIAGKTEKSIVDIASDILLALGLASRRDELVTFVQDRAHNDACYPITNQKLRALGWKEQIPWDFGLAQTVTWFQLRVARLADDAGGGSMSVLQYLEAHGQWKTELPHPEGVGALPSLTKAQQHRTDTEREAVAAACVPAI